MKKLVTSGLAGYWYAFLFAGLTIFAAPGVGFAQGCVMTCPPALPPVPVSVSALCFDVLTYPELGVTATGCTGEITVEIFDNGVSLGNTITIGMAGNTYMVIVSNPASGQSCMMNILVLDDQAPILICPADVTLECTADLDQYNGLPPENIFDCSSTTVYINDVLLSSGNCDDEIIAEYGRVYIVVDSFGNADSCEQLISLEKVGLDEVDFPPDLTGLNALPCFPIPNTTPDSTGFPSVGGVPIVNGTFCNISATFTDVIGQVCSGSYKIFRTWIVYDWCESNVSIDSTQIIEIIDNTGPLVQAPADMTISTSSLTCNATPVLLPAIISDDCSTQWTVRMQGVFGTIQSNGGPIPTLPVGVYTITYIATNDCNQVGSDQMVLTIADLQPPIPVCHQTLSIPLDNTGNALIPASAFNAASQDNCNAVYFKVKRMSLPVGYTCANPGNPTNLFDDAVQFCCEDIDNNEIMVILRVYDQPTVPGPVSDTYLQGHFNDCMVSVVVQDKLPPQITCPSDLTISCEFPFTLENLNVFGEVVLSPDDQELICIVDPASGIPGIQCLGTDGLALDNCSVDVTSTASLNINNCGVGTLIRTFTATDDGGLQATCQQLISIINFNPFDITDITWPLDYTTSNICNIDLLDPEDLLPPFNEPVVNEGPCDLVAASYTDMVFDFSNTDQACFKILRTWTVIDWCQLNTPAGGMWTHLQVIKVMNNVGPVIDPIDDLNECSFDPECGGLTLELSASAADDCSGPLSLTWKYSIDFGNNNTFDFVSGSIIDDTINFSVDFPLGTHRVLYSVSDQCGNITVEEQFITVESCKGPSAKCIHGLSTNLMPMDLDGDGNADWGMVVVQAEMFDAGSDHPCGNPVSVAFSADPTDVTRVFDCDDLGNVEIELWVIDNNGLTDFCITYLEVQDNNGVCPPDQGGLGVISGSLTVPGAGKLSNAMVYLDGSNHQGIPSGDNGYFVFPSMPFGGQYEVRPTRDGDDVNGVTALDLVKIQKHLLGIEVFQSPYQYIAADANNSKSITAIDIIQLRKLILGFYNDLPNNTSWRFVDEGHVFPDPANPWLTPWNETYLIQPFQANMSDVNFNSVKVGDVNLSANLKATNGFIQPRTSQICDITYEVYQPQDDIYKVDVLLNDAHLFNALQMSFGWDHYSFELMEWLPGSKLSAEDFRLMEENAGSLSVITFNINAWEDQQLSLTTLWFRKRDKAPGKFSLYLQPKPTVPVAYIANTEEPVRIVLTKTVSPNEQVRNNPNPFKDRTTLYFNSLRNEQAQLTAFDLNGKVVLTRDVTLTTGENEFIITRSELKGAGIYVYEIKSAFQHSTNRMIIVE